VWRLLTDGIETAILWVPGHFGIPGNEDVDHQANLAGHPCGSTGIKWPSTSD
jgi:ribonuclease HI